MNEIASSELVLNPDGSVYHLHLLPEDIAPILVLVGDPGRVEKLSRHFDRVEMRKQNREFVTHTGWYRNQRLTVLSTGIGTDNIDIVLNELDALVNIDFATRRVKEELTSLSLVRIGTCGVIRPEVGTGSMLISELAIGFDGLLRFYGGVAPFTLPDAERAFRDHMQWPDGLGVPYFTRSAPSLFSHLLPGNLPVTTVSAPGFFGPQGRVLRLPLADPDLHAKLLSFAFQDIRITNFEMECSAIYGLSNMLGHSAVTLCAAIANRATGEFDHQYPRTMENLIGITLDRLAEWKGR
jgi:uridine phosphorylase